MATTGVIKSEPHGYRLFTPKEGAIYRALVKKGDDKSLSIKERKRNRKNAAAQLEYNIKYRMSATEQDIVKADKQAILDRRLVEIAYGASLLDDEDRVVYYALICEATDPVTSNARRNICNRSATSRADNAATKQAKKDEQTAMTPEELEIYKNSEQVVAAKEKTQTRKKKWKTSEAARNAVRHEGMSAADVAMEKANKAAKAKPRQDRHNKIRKELREIGDPAEIARNEQYKKVRVERKRRVLEDKNAKLAEQFGESGRRSTKFGEGVFREKAIAEVVSKIMGNHAGFVHPKGDATSKKWVKDQGDVSVEQTLRGGKWAAYILITRTGIVPGEEAQCVETRKFILECRSNPLWRIEEDEDLKRFTIAQARSVIKPYLLAECDNATM
jgi:hypothetical protein